MGVGADACDHLLAVAQHLNGGNGIPQNGTALKVQQLCLPLHLLLKGLRHLSELAFQQQHRLLHAAAVFLPRHTGATETVAASHVVVETGALFADIAGELLAAGRELQRLRHRIQRRIGIVPPTEGAEIAGAVIADLIDKRKAWIFPAAEPHKGIALVILQQDIIAGLMALDEGVFQHQRLKLTGDHDGVKLAHLLHHEAGLEGVGSILAEILTHTILQFFRLAHIDHRAALVHHQIDTGGKG